MSPCCVAARDFDINSSVTDSENSSMHECVSSTIRRFSTIGRYCRLGLVPLWPLTVISSVACVEVSISAPSGHDPYVSTKNKDVLLSHLCPDGYQDRKSVV